MRRSLVQWQAIHLHFLYISKAMENSITNFSFILMLASAFYFVYNSVPLLFMLAGSYWCCSLKIVVWICFVILSNTKTNGAFWLFAASKRIPLNTFAQFLYSSLNHHPFLCVCGSFYANNNGSFRHSKSKISQANICHFLCEPWTLHFLFVLDWTIFWAQQ